MTAGVQTPPRASEGLISRLDDFVRALLPVDLKPSTVRDRKAIHDCVWGTNIFHRHEIAVIDTALLQRLRRISQTGLAFYTYPSARHSRFEHSLGVAMIATRFASRLNERYPGLLESDPDKGDLAEIRLACLLHDCGHGPFSHASEEAYKWNADIQELLRADFYADADAQEILSFLIITSQPFRQFFENVQRKFRTRIDLDTVAQLVIGRHPQRDKTFVAEMVNGPFDADKLDYLARDGHFCGLQLPSDVDRLLYTVSTHQFGDGHTRLVVESPVPVEQILFSKMMLYSSLYHHQKVRAAEAYFRAIVEMISTQNLTLDGNPCADPSDLLRLEECTFLGAASIPNHDGLKRMVTKLGTRDLPRRAVVFCKDSIDNFDECGEYLLVRLSKLPPSELLALRAAIVQKLPAAKRCSVNELCIDLPVLPTLREARQTHVAIHAAKDPVPVTELFPIEGWLRAYGTYRWKGHVFCPAGVQREVFEATKAVLAHAKPVPIILNDLAWQLARAPSQPGA